MKDTRATVTVEWVAARCHEDGDCLLWDGAVSTNGYPVAYIWADGVRSRKGVRRLVWEVAYGKRIGSRQRMITICGNRLCLCQEHLMPATRAMISAEVANRIDVRTRADKALSVFSRATRAKITIDDAIRIRESNESLSQLALRYPISVARLSKIRRGEAWRDFTASPFAGLGAR